TSSSAVVTGLIRELNINETLVGGGGGGSPLTPPSKRHCRSLSVPEELSRCRSPWKPGSKIWTPVTKRRCHSGGSATLQRCNSQGWGSVGGAGGFPCFPAPVTPPESPVPRPASASAGWGPERPHAAAVAAEAGPGAGPPFHLLEARRRLSLSQERITESGRALLWGHAGGTPETGRRAAPTHVTTAGTGHSRLPRCRSQPCVSNERKSGLKRRRDDDVRWIRPSLDFLKMT
uniref:Family with sequence similarity 53 member A n=1 Tax=Petromyzon marinus TaxID=7757 RepID=S4RDJ3_PETMA